MIDEKKADFSFLFFIILAFFLLAIDLSFIYFLSSNNLSGFELHKDSTLSFFVNLLIKLKASVLGYYFVNKIAIIALISFASYIKNTKKKIKTEKEKAPLKTYIIYASITGTAFIASKYIIGNIPIGYLLFTVVLFFLYGFYIAKITDYFKSNLLDDRFGLEGRKFDQTKDLVENEYSVNIKTTDGYINNINPFRASMVLGTPGSGKTYSILLEAIEQHIKKGFAMYIYDFKYPDLAKFAYNCYVKYKDNYKVQPQFCVLNFNDPQKTHRCNPLQPDLLNEFLDAVESAKALMLGLNKSWIEKEGDFFVEGPINLVAICIWALKLYKKGKYCSLPHVIELVSSSYNELFDFLQSFDDASIQNVLAAFKSALKNEAYDQLEGQVASVRNPLTRLTSPMIYYVMTTGNEEFENISLDINNPEKPKILCIGNNPQRQQVLSACISLYNSVLIRQVNQQKKLKCALVYDELPTLSFPKGTIDNLIATGRSNLVSTWLGFQDKQQLIRDFGDKNAKAVFNTIGNIYTGMVTGDTAQDLSKGFGKIKVLKKSESVSAKGEVSQSFSEEMQDTIAASTLSTLPQGMFAGQIADTHEQPIEQKFFHSKILIDNEYRKTLKKYDIPIIFDYKKLGLTTDELLNSVFNKIRNDMKEILLPYSKKED